MDASVASVLPSRFKQSEAEQKSRVVIVGQSVFNLRLEKLIAEVADLEVVATATTMKEALAFPNEYGAELTIVDTDFGGDVVGVSLARDISERSPGCAIMLVCGPFTQTLAQNIWVYTVDSWSVVSQATAKNHAEMMEAVSSTVHGMKWVEPGIQRELQKLGPRPRSLDERKLAMFDRPSQRIA